MECPKCGYNNDSEALYCNLCHEVFKRASDYREPSSFYEPYRAERKHWKKWLGFDVALTLLIIVGLGLWGYKFMEKKNLESAKTIASDTAPPLESSNTGFGDMFSDLTKFNKKIFYPSYEVEHFIIYGQKEDEVKALGQKMELYVDMPIKIGIGDFGFWQKGKVHIYIHNTSQDYQKITGRNSQTSGYSIFETRSIHSYWETEYLFEAVIPHELCHLILHAFMENKAMPKWIDEGFATFVETKYCHAYNLEYQRLLGIIKQGKYFPLEALDNTDITKGKEIENIHLWYVQTLSIVTYLIDNYGSDKFFRNFLINLRDGKNLDDSLSAAYSPDITCIGDLEQKWLEYIKTYKQAW
ncbi:MAG: peptidase MA family metallohydrolase [Candidatus Desantisbacteria bacterium]